MDHTTDISREAKVCITRNVKGSWKEMLSDAGVRVVCPDDDGGDRAWSRQEFLTCIQGCHGVGCMLSERWDAEAFDAAGEQLRVVANYAVGYNNIDLEEARSRGVWVTNTPDVLTDATADVAWALLMAAARCTGSAERSLRAGEFHGWEPNGFLGVDLVGRTLGIIGAGRIGTATARRARGWDMQVVYAHHRSKPEFEQATGGRRVDLDSLLAESDFISLHVPLTPETRHMIGAREFGLMKPTAVLVNTARGPVVDEAALVEALRSGQIFAAGLDVYEDEPRMADGLVGLENAVLLPHIGSATEHTRAVMGELMATNILAALRGQEPPNKIS
ncbi:D-glycerate dehydrogenase [candidate division BRC1 bacterium HGW-BRC1-1]|jgi:glyoxylate reductase|nr:MAG: D-glycerate dehydrogenase [candidate division BRC1 bacterium HGW-BRC1-1]